MGEVRLPSFMRVSCVLVFVVVVLFVLFCFLSWSLYPSPCKIKTHKTCEDVPLVEFMYLVFTHMPVESYRR